MLSKKLWGQNRDLAAACLENPFVRGLASGKLDKEAFKRYVAQDAFYLGAFRKGFALALARSDDLAQAKILHGLMAGVLEELNLHKEYSKKLGIGLDDVEPMPATRAYTDFLLRVAWQGSVGEIIAAMTPCMKLYAWLGAELKKTRDPETPYKEWIDTYSAQEMQELAGKMERLLDETAPDNEVIADLYRYAMECELQFFAEPLEDPKKP